MYKTTITTYGNKQHMKGQDFVHAIYGTFYTVGNRVEWFYWDSDGETTDGQADDYFTDDLNKLKEMAAAA